jgi:putative holliday junction resolvase
MARLLALDVGEKTIGTATCDETGTFCFAGHTIRRQPEGYRKDMAAIRQLVQEKSVEQIVVGMPFRMDGTRGTQAEKVEVFIEALRRFVDVPVVCQDERLSTAEAEWALQDAAVRRDRRKAVIDSVAASVILQAYLDRTRTARGQGV